MIALVALIILPFAAASADQTDPRLDRLFAVLQTTDSDREARQAEQLIWAIWVHSDDPSAQSSMSNGIEAMSRNRLDDALAIFDRLVLEAPDFAEGWNKRATIHFMLGNLEQSIADVDHTLDLEPRHFGALSGLGQISLAQRDEASALAAFEDALAMNPRLSGSQGIIDALRSRVRGDPL
ncbi:MAG: tetratricopeptide repeat protein [Alphaproteobacteria bacterium]